MVRRRRPSNRVSYSRGTAVTWKLHKVVLYSHDGRRHSIPDKGFRETVSIVVGDSNTGKSAILEIVNYCLGASECEIADYIRRRSTWVGVQLRRGGQFVVLCRQVPATSKKSTDNYFLKVSNTDALPDSALQAMGPGPLESFERLLGIGSIKIEDERIGSGFTVSIRHSLPYSLVRDDVIINKAILVSGARDEKKARHLRETLPYFLGHITEETIRRREELRRRRAELRVREAELAQRRLIAHEGSLRTTRFIDQARALGLLPPDLSLAEPAQRRAALKNVAEFQLSAPTLAPDSRRHSLEATLSDTRQQLLKLQERRRVLQRAAADANQFWSAAKGQFGRLEALDLIEEGEELHECPICRSDLLERAEPISTLREAMAELRRDIGEVSYDRPRLDRHLIELDNQIDALKQQQQLSERLLEEEIRVDARLERDRGLDEARLRLSGQVEFYLDSSGLEGSTVDEADIEELRASVARLELEVSAASIVESMNEDAVLVSSDMKSIIAALPFAGEYRDAVPIFDWRNLQIALKDGQRRIPMPAIGSDENYLTLHLAFFLSIQKLFSVRKRPVLNFIILDQVTRPYFPDTDFEEVVELPSSDSEESAPDRRLSDEAGKVRSILTVLFQRALEPHAPQIIICEKANFRRDPQYQEAIVAFWASPQGMVPADWPTETNA